MNARALSRPAVKSNACISGVERGIPSRRVSEKRARQVKNSDNNTAFATSSASLTENKWVMPSRMRNTRNATREETNAIAQYNATGRQPSNDESTGALRIHNASNGETN